MMNKGLASRTGKCLAILYFMTCLPGVLPNDGVEQQQLIGVTEAATGLSYLECMGANWLRERGDPEALMVRVTWVYPALGCRRREHEELAGDLTVDDRVDLPDLAEYGRWWLSPPVAYP